MNPTLALFGCLLFILFLFIADSKRRPKTSSALWIPAIWFLIVSTKPVTVWFQAGGADLGSPENYLEGSPGDAAVFLILIVAALIIISRRRLQLSKIIGNNAWLFAFLLYCGVSTIWSDYTFVSFKRWIKEIGNFSMVLIVATETYPVEAFKTLFRRCAYFAIPLSIVLIKYFPDLGRMFTRSGDVMYVGATVHKNSLGMLCALIMVVFIWDYKNWRKTDTAFAKRDKYIHVLLLLMNTWLLYIAQSATSIMCGIIGIATVVGMELPFIKKNVRYIGTYILSFTLLILLLDYVFDLRELLLSNLGRDETLTGRTQIWAQVLTVGSDPFIGTGYESFWLGDRIQKFWDMYWWRPNQAHNGYLEVYLNLGWVGVFFLAGIIVSSYRKTIKNLAVDYDYQKIRMSLFVIALLSNLTEAYFKGICQIWFVFLMVIVAYPRPAVQSDRQYAAVGERAGVLNPAAR